MAEIEDVRIDDLRRTFVAVMAMERKGQKTDGGFLKPPNEAKAANFGHAKFASLRASHERAAAHIAAHMAPQIPSPEPRVKGWRF